MEAEAVGFPDIDAVQNERVEVHVEVEGGAEALDDRDGAGPPAP